MYPLFWIDVVSRVVHVGTAITLVGGAAFMLLVLQPAANSLDDATHATLRQRVTSRWKRFVHIGIALFLISGFYNYWRAMESHRGDGLYHALIGTKMLVALVVFFLASALVGRSEKLQRFRDRRVRWLSVMVLLATGIVAVSGFLRIRGARPSSSADRPAEVDTQILDQQVFDE